MNLDHWRDLISPEDLDAFRKKGMPRRMGYGESLAMLVVDMTYLFIDSKYGPSAWGTTGWEAVDAWAELLEVARGKGTPIFYSRRGKRTSPVDRGVCDLKWGGVRDALYLNDPRADEWPPQIAPAEGDIIIEKAKPSALFETPLRSMLNFLAVDTLIIGGIATSACVRCTITDAFSCNFRVIVPEECCADTSLFAHRTNLLDIEMKFADVEPLANVLSHMSALPVAPAKRRSLTRATDPGPR